MPKLLVLFDGSQGALRALRHAVSVAMYVGDIAIHVVTTPERPAVPPAGLASGEERPVLPLACAEQLIREAGVHYTREVITGDAAESIARLADEIRCDGIVIANQGAGTMAARVVDLARVPVTLVR